MNLDLLDGLSEGEWWKDMAGTEEEDKKERRHAQIIKREAEELEKSGSVAVTVKQPVSSIRCCRTRGAEKDVANDLKRTIKMELKQGLLKR